MASSTRTPAKKAAASKGRPTPARPRPQGAAPVTPPALEPVELEDGTQVVFSFTNWLTERGLTASKPVEVGGRIFHFKAVGTTEDNALLFQHMATGKYKEALELQLVDPSEVDDLLGLLRVPFATADESKMWLAFTEAVSGVTLGESAAS